MRNIADGAAYTTSSRWGDIGLHPFAGEPTPGVKFHTDFEVNPWLLMDFGAPYEVREIVVYNRSDACQDRAETIMVEASTDGLSFDMLYQAGRTIFDGVAGTAPLRITVRNSTAYRFMKFSLQEGTYFHLDFIQVFAAPFWRQAAPSVADNLALPGEDPEPIAASEAVEEEERLVQVEPARALTPLPDRVAYTPPSPIPPWWRRRGAIAIAVVILVILGAWLLS